MAALASTAALLLGVLAFNAFVDPWGGLGTGIFPTLVPTDKPVKAALVAHLKKAPQLIIFGSSRALKIDPAYLQKKLGQSGFNAAVSDGNPEDAWAFLNDIHARFPNAHPHFLWVLDVEALRGAPDPGVLDTPALARFIPAKTRWSARLYGILPLLSWKAVRASVKVLQAEVSGKGIHLKDAVFTNNGYRSLDVHDIARADGSTLAAQLRASESLYSWVYRTIYPRLSPTEEGYVERTLAQMDAWGYAPVIVLSPIHPALRKVLAPLGWTARYHQVLAYMASLKPKYRFTFLDMTSISSFGGSPNLFYDGLHLTLPNVHRMLDAILRKAPGAL